MEPDQPKKLAIGVPGGFALPQDRYIVNEKWCLRRFPGHHSLDIPCPKDNSDASDLSHLEGLSLSPKVKSAINSIQRCDSAILVAERAGAVQAWEVENVRPISKFAHDLLQLDNGVKVPPTWVVNRSNFISLINCEAIYALIFFLHF